MTDKKQSKLSLYNMINNLLTGKGWLLNANSKPKILFWLNKNIKSKTNAKKDLDTKKE